MPNLEEAQALIFFILGLFAIVAWHRLTKTYTDFRNKEIIKRNGWNFNLDSTSDVMSSLKEKYLFFKNIKTFQPVSYIQGSFEFRQFKLFEITHSFNTKFSCNRTTKF